MKKKTAFLVTLCMCLTLLAGCGGTPSGNSPDSTQQPSAPPASGTRENIVRMTADSTPILDPGAHTGNASSIAYANLYDTLVFPGLDGIEPNLAESWEPSEDGTSFTFKLKQNVKFHDGSEVTASDVVFTYNRLNTIGEGFAYLYKGIIKDAVAEDDYTVTFHLNSSYGPFVSTLCRMYILNEELVMEHLADGAYGEYGDYGREWLLSNDAGSGPYTATEMVQNDYFLATKFDGWHGGWDSRPNAPKQFKIIYGTEAATVRTMMSTQTLEISDMWQTTESYAALDALEGVDLATYSTRLVQNIFFNCTRAPLDDVNVRKAICCLIDYDTLIDVAFTGSAQPAGPVSSYTSGHIDCTQYPYSTEEAAKYIAQSSYADTIGDYTLEFLQISENSFLEKVALAMQAAGKQVGVNIEITKAPWNTYQERVSTAESTPHLASCNSGPSFNEAGATLESQFHSKTAGSYENSSWICNDELDAKINDAMSTIDDTERYEKYAVLQTYITDELCPTAWLADLVERVAYQTEYIEFPAAEATKSGDVTAYLMGYPFFMPDISIYTDR